MATGGNKKVVILGAGTAGLSTALTLAELASVESGVEVTLLDQHNYHLFLPLLYQVVTGGVEPGHICFPIRSLLREKHIRFRESHVTDIDLKRRILVTDDGNLGWDYLVIAPGSVTHFFGLADVQRNAFQLKSLRDAIAIHNHIVGNYEIAVQEENAQRRQELLTFVIVGGGATGVELAASIQDFVSKVLSRDYPRIRPDEAQVILVEAQGSVLPKMTQSMAAKASNRLKAMGAQVLCNTRIVNAWPEAVQTADGQTIPTRTLIWVAGVKPVSIVEAQNLDKARDGRIMVGPNLELPGLPGVYIAGDCAYIATEEQPEGYPPTGQIAMRQGLACAQNIIRTIGGKPQKPFQYRYKGELISMGRNKAVAEIGGHAFDGLPAWLLWRIYYLGKLMGFKNKLSVALDWSFAYFYRRNTARLE